MQILHGKKQNRNSWNEIKDLEWIKGKKRIKKKQIFFTANKFKEALLSVMKLLQNLRKLPELRLLTLVAVMLVNFTKTLFISTLSLFV